MFKKFAVILIPIVYFALSANAFPEDAKIGVMNFRKIFYEYKETKDFQKELESKDEEAKKEFEKKADEIRKLRDEISLLSEKAKEKKETALREKAMDLDKFRRDKGEDLLRWRDAKVADIDKVIRSAAADFAQKNGYDMILDNIALVYSSDKDNLTEEILKELNK